MNSRKEGFVTAHLSGLDAISAEMRKIREGGYPYTIDDLSEGDRWTVLNSFACGIALMRLRLMATAAEGDPLETIYEQPCG
jgi:hypothetical protein